MKPRRRISKRERAEIFEREGGICHLCRKLIVSDEPYNRFIISHDRARELTAEGDDPDRPENLKVAHKWCHDEWTAKYERPLIAKAKRLRAPKKPKRAWPKRKLRNDGKDDK